MQVEKGAYYASLKIIGRLADVLDVEPADHLNRENLPFAALRQAVDAPQLLTSA